jgi:hypothetical protein
VEKGEVWKTLRTGREVAVEAAREMKIPTHLPPRREENTMHIYPRDIEHIWWALRQETAYITKISTG